MENVSRRCSPEHGKGNERDAMSDDTCDAMSDDTPNSLYFHSLHLFSFCCCCCCIL